MVRACVIFGTGLLDIPNFFSNTYDSKINLMRSESEWGSVPIYSVVNNDDFIFFINRHHSTDSLPKPPHIIEHRANIHAVISTMPDFIICINSVGSIHDGFAPGQISLTSDIIDLSDYSWSFHDTMAIHADRTSMFDDRLKLSLSKIIKNKQKSFIPEIVVAQCNGPQFESPAEINALEIMGANAVNMTIGPESRLLSEHSVPFVSLIYSANWASGRDPNNKNNIIDHHKIERNGSIMVKIISECIDSLINSSNSEQS